MKTSSNGRALIRNAEGDKLTAYKCPAGILTIGVGHTGRDVRPGQTITQAQSDALLVADLAKFEAAVTRLVKVPLTQNQFDALVSFTFNLGAGALGASTLLKKLNAGDYVGAAVQFTAWDKARVSGVLRALPGLTKRRAAEAALFVKP
jgi:lysozyme